MRIWPYLHEYLKTNYFTFILVCAITAAIFLKYTPCIYLWKSRGFPEKTSKISNRQWLLIFIVLGILLRVLWLLVCRYRPAFSWPEVFGQQTWTEYNEINIYAASIRNGIWFRSAEGLAQARRPIGYPVFLGLFYTIFGAKTIVLYFLNLALFAFSAVFFFKIASTLFGSHPALWATFLYCVYPLSVYSVSLPLDEHLFIPLWFSGLYLLLKELRGEKVRLAWLWYGLLFGYATMTRTHTMFMPFVVGYVYCLLRRSWKKVLAVVFAVFMIGQMINLPWVIRNYRQWGIYLPYTATFYSIYYANNPVVKHANLNGEIPRQGEEGYNAELTRAVAVYDVPKMEALSKKEVSRWIIHHPGEFIVLGIERWLHFMGTSRERGVWVIDLVEQALKDSPKLRLSPPVRHISEEMAFGAYYLLLYFFLFGLVWICRTWTSMGQVQRRALKMIGVCFFLYLAEQFLIYPERKYRFALELFMLMVAGAFFSYLLNNFKPSKSFFWTQNRNSRSMQR